ncbi:MAG: DUF928 domain-containing protein [Leptolyngbyaceae cyanobacterium]
MPLNHETSHLPFHILLNKAIKVARPQVSWQWGRYAALGLAIVGVLSAPIAVDAEEEPVRQGLPGRRISGASRLPTSACAPNSEPLVAIVPETNLGATAVAEPTLWLSVPNVAVTKQMEFYLFNTQDEIIYQTSFWVKPTADLVGLDLAAMANAPKLEVDQRYRWAASIVCNPNNHSENISVEGWVDRIENSGANETGPWYDRLGTLVETLQHQPDNQEALNQWQSLMASARLDQIVPLSVTADAVEITSPAQTDAD